MQGRTINGLKQAGQGVLDLLYPPHCGICGTGLEEADAGWCWDCRRGVELIAPPFCSCCGLPAAGTIEHDYQCHSCTRHPPRFTAARSVARFDGPLREAIHGFKYEQNLSVEPALSDLLYGGLQAYFHLNQIDAIVPVPLFRSRLRRRGYNQAALLAQGLARRSGLPCQPQLLQRLRDTHSQIGLSLAQRRANMRGAFTCKSPEKAKGLTLLLVDDVMTTSATTNECARALFKAKAKTVLVLTLARG